MQRMEKINGNKAETCKTQVSSGVKKITIPDSSKKLKIELSYDPAIPPLDIYPKELKSGFQKDICIPIFTAALFTKARMWK